MTDPILLGYLQDLRKQNSFFLKEMTSLRDDLRKELTVLRGASRWFKKQNVHNLARIMSLKQQVKELEEALKA